jgi:hypothetical protein
VRRAGMELFSRACSDPCRESRVFLATIGASIECYPAIQESMNARSESLGQFKLLKIPSLGGVARSAGVGLFLRSKTPLKSPLVQGGNAVFIERGAAARHEKFP